MVIFISYRRDDTLLIAASLYRSLQRSYKLEEMFFDFPRQTPGALLQNKLIQYVSDSEVVIAVIGKQWADRLWNPDDLVKLEIETALAARKRIFPVMADGAVMPPSTKLPETVRKIRDFEGTILNPLRFDEDVDVLAAAIGEERKRMREEQRLDQQLRQAIAEDNYSKAASDAEALIKVAWDISAALQRLQEVRKQWRSRVERAAPDSARAKQLLAEKRFTDALNSANQALQISPGETELLSLKKTISEAAEKDSIQRTVDRLLALSGNDMLEAAESAADELASAKLSKSQLSAIFHPRVKELRKALIRNPQNLSLRMVYLTTRGWEEERDDRRRGRFRRGLLFAVCMYVVCALSAWRAHDLSAFPLTIGVTFFFVVREQGAGGCLVAFVWLMFIWLGSIFTATPLAFWPAAVVVVGLSVVHGFLSDKYPSEDYGPMPFFWHVTLPSRINARFSRNSIEELE